MTQPGPSPHRNVAPADRPPHYPAQFERPVRLRDGRWVDVRPIVPADAPELAEAIRTADPETLRRRFLGGPPPTTPRLMEHLTVVDYRTRFALVARDPRTGHGVGIARYEGLGDGVAEVAVAVDRGWRRVGLATALVRMLAEAAAARGFDTFSASYQADNRAVETLFAEAGGAGFIREGVAEREVDLPAGGTLGVPVRRRRVRTPGQPDGARRSAATITAPMTTRNDRPTSQSP